MGFNLAFKGLITTSLQLRRGKEQVKRGRSD